MAENIYDPAVIDLESLRAALEMPTDDASVTIRIKDPVSGAWSDSVALA